jgi:hypothetical protein
MRAVTRIVLTTAGVGTATIGSAIAVNAQYYYPPPGYDYPPPPRRVMAVMAGEPGTAVPRLHGSGRGLTNRIVAPRAAAGEPGTVAHGDTLSKAVSADRTAAIRLVEPI